MLLLEPLARPQDKQKGPTPQGESSPVPQERTVNPSLKLSPSQPPGSSHRESSGTSQIVLWFRSILHHCHSPKLYWRLRSELTRQLCIDCPASLVIQLCPVSTSHTREAPPI